MYMFTFEVSENYLSEQEQNEFDEFLKHKGLEKNIWPLFATLFRSKVKSGIPLMLRIYENEILFGAVVLVKCNRYGRALFNNRLLAGILDLIKIPYIQWIKFGCGMDVMSNPGFVKYPEREKEMINAVIEFLQKNFFTTIVTDFSANRDIYNTGSELPSLPWAVINCKGMNTIEDYTRDYKNIKRKLIVFRKKGGEYHLHPERLNDEQLLSLKRCFISTADNSAFYLPYQELYLKVAVTTAGTVLKDVYYFTATLNGEFIGYQAALKTGKYLNALHGAFDRNRKSNFHAYDILFVKMTEFAIQHGLELVDFGLVLNYTKQKMVNQTKPMSYFILSKSKFVNRIFTGFLKMTKIQSKEQHKFRESG